MKIKRPLQTAASPQILVQLTQIWSTPPLPTSHSKGSKYAASIKAPQRKRIPRCCLTFKIIIPRSLQESLPLC